MAGKYEAKRRRTRKQSGKRKAWSVVRTVFVWTVMLAAVAMMIFTVVSVSTFDRNDRALFGYKAFVVRSDSMAATDFGAGDLVLLKEVDPATLEPGDIIAFRSADPNSMGETVTHKIRRITALEDGSPAFVTYGTTTGVDDAYPVGYAQVQGKYQVALAGVGAFFAFLKTTPGYICCILLLFLVPIILQGLSSIKLFRQYKAEQLAEIEAKRKKEMEEMAAERKKLAAERVASQKLLAELQRLQAQLTGSNLREGPGEK